MAISGASGEEVARAWEAYVPSDPVDNIFDRFWLLEQLRSNGSFEKQNGSKIRVNLEYAENTNVKFMSEMETLTVSKPDVFDNAEFTWKFQGGDVPITDFERDTTAGGAGKFDIEAKKIDNLKKSLEKAVNTSLFSDGTGTSSKEFGGLQLLVSSTPTTGTVGLINRATYSFWRNQQNSGNGTAFNALMSAMRISYNNCSNGIGEQNPTYAVTTQTVFQGYEGLLVANEQISRTSSSDKGVSGFKGQHIMFKDIHVAYDSACPADVLYMLNNRNLKFIYMAWMKAEKPVRPSDGFWDVFKVRTTGNLITDNPRRLGVVTAIA
jgi:hypothetical protein